MGGGRNDGQAGIGNPICHEFGVGRWSGKVQFTDDDLGGTA